ncbi:MAG: PhzF family phenazine biosynthesis protein [Acidobacteriota bacterium]|nr:PhzF family phenazine biosynthesis protein [Acidobacteriota bacterium]
MELPLYQVDAFTDRLFSGNPAAVCPLDEWLGDELLQAIAAENNLSETAFFVPRGEIFELRWFTPTVEVALCGHATLASAYVLFSLLDYGEDVVRFATRQSGELRVRRMESLLEMDFPARPPTVQSPPSGLVEALGAPVQTVLGSAEDLLVVLESPEAVAAMQPDLAALAKVECRGVIVTARGGGSPLAASADGDADFVSRFFAPRAGVPEDPVTGSAHCVLTPYWAKELNRKELTARQISRRGGTVRCRHEGDRVTLGGAAVLYLQGTVSVS